MSDTLSAVDIIQAKTSTRRHLLLVGFPDQQAKGISWAMKKAAWDCETIENRQEALRVSASFKYDLIVFFMDEMDASVLFDITEIRRQGRTNEGTTVFVAGPNFLTEHEKKLLAAGVSEVIALSDHPLPEPEVAQK